MISNHSRTIGPKLLVSDQGFGLFHSKSTLKSGDKIKFDEVHVHVRVAVLQLAKVLDNIRYNATKLTSQSDRILPSGSLAITCPAFI